MRRFLQKALQRFPALHKGVRAAYWELQYDRVPKLCPNGFVINGPPSMQSGEFERTETLEIMELLKEASVFINVGANVGYYTCLARRSDLKTIAIEPLEQNVQMLMRNLLANDWDDVEVFPVAVGSEASLMKLYGGGTAASLVPGWAGAFDSHYRVVPVVPLDVIVGHRFSGSRILILMDIEGFEYHALLGARSLLQQRPSPTWFVEVCTTEHQPRGARVNPYLSATFELFWEYGYRAELVGGGKRTITRSDVSRWSGGVEPPKNHNFIFRRSADM